MATRLRREVWLLDRCSGCGACVAACSKGVLHWGDEQHPLLEERQKALGLSHLKLRTCEVCQKFCELSCPRLGERMPLAPVSTVSARAAGVGPGGHPNDVIRSLLVAARSADLIDGAVMLDLDAWSLAPVARVATTVDEIVACVGVQYLWAPVLSRLNEAIFERRLERLAVVGSPCMAQGVRRLLAAQDARLGPYRKAIRLTIAAFCVGMYMPALVMDLLERAMGIARSSIRGLATSAADGGLRVTLWDGSERTIGLTQVEPFARHGCASCDDYLGEEADLAVGTVGALPGHTTLISRTAAGEALLQNACRFGLLTTWPEVDEAALSVARADKGRRGRAEALAEFRLLMLDALSDPRKRAEVRKQFVSLYGTPPLGAAEREVNHGDCRGCAGGEC